MIVKLMRDLLDAERPAHPARQTPTARRYIWRRTRQRSDRRQIRHRQIDFGHRADGAHRREPASSFASSIRKATTTGWKARSGRRREARRARSENFDLSGKWTPTSSSTGWPCGSTSGLTSSPICCQSLPIPRPHGRPHWLIIDEAHHLLPAARDGAACAAKLPAAILITVHPGAFRQMPRRVETVIALGAEGEEGSRLLQETGGTRRGVAPTPEIVLFWRPPERQHRESGRKPQQSLKRHSRKYAEGELDERQLLFPGPDDEINLRAHNLMIFLQIAEGIDEKTWEHHLRAGDYSNWFRDISRTRNSPTRPPASRPIGSLDRKREPLPHRRRGAAPLYRSGRLTF